MHQIRVGMAFRKAWRFMDYHVVVIGGVSSHKIHNLSRSSFSAFRNEKKKAFPHTRRSLEPTLREGWRLDMMMPISSPRRLTMRQVDTLAVPSSF